MAKAKARRAARSGKGGGAKARRGEGRRASANRAAAAERTVERLERQILRAKGRLEKARRAVPPVPVEDYLFRRPSGRPVRLSELFGGKDDLVVVFNMGRQCPMCTTWADGLNGVVPHLEDRAGFVVASPDPVAEQKAFAAGRGWRFRMVSAEENTFFADMGFASADGSPWPGIATFRREADGRIVRVARTGFGPGDDFSPVFAVLPLLHGGQGDWWPKFDYAAAPAAAGRATPRARPRKAPKRPAT